MPSLVDAFGGANAFVHKADVNIGGPECGR